MKLLRLDLSKRNHVDDFEIFETESNDLWEFGELLYNDEMEYINDGGHDDDDRMEREDEVDYYVFETYMEFTYDYCFRSRFYLVDHEDNKELIEAALQEDVNSPSPMGFTKLDEVLQKKL